MYVDIPNILLFRIYNLLYANIKIVHNNLNSVMLASSLHDRLIFCFNYSFRRLVKKTHTHSAYSLWYKWSRKEIILSNCSKSWVYRLCLVHLVPKRLNILATIRAFYIQNTNLFSFAILIYTQKYYWTWRVNKMVFVQQEQRVKLEFNYSYTKSQCKKPS